MKNDNNHSCSMLAKCPVLVSPDGDAQDLVSFDYGNESFAGFIRSGG